MYVASVCICDFDGLVANVSQERYNPRTASWHLVPATCKTFMIIHGIANCLSVWCHFVGPSSCLEAMLQQRFAPAAAAVAGKLYVCGGADVSWQFDAV